jgi:flagellar motor switch protein FliN
MEEIEYTQLEPTDAATAPDARLERLRDVPVDVVVEIGRTRMRIGEALKLTPGSVIGLNRLAGDPVNRLVNGKPIARGEVVVVDEEFGLRVTEVVSDSGATLSAAAPAPPVAPEPVAPELAAAEPVAAEPVAAEPVADPQDEAA